MKDNLPLITFALVIGLVICALALIPADKSRECDQYADKPITEAPAKCIEYFGGVR